MFKYDVPLFVQKCDNPSRYVNSYVSVPILSFASIISDKIVIQ